MTCIIYKHIFYYVCKLIKLLLFLGNWLIMNKRATITYITSSLHVVPYRKSLSQSTSTVLRFVIVCDKVGKPIIRISFCVFLVCFLAFDFCRFCVVIRSFHLRHNDLRLRRIFHPRFYPLHLFSLIPEKEPVFPFFNVQC